MLGKAIDFIGLMDHLEDRGLLESGEYFVVGVSLDEYEPHIPNQYLEGRFFILRSYLFNLINL